MTTGLPDFPLTTHPDMLPVRFEVPAVNPAIPGLYAATFWTDLRLRAEQQPPRPLVQMRADQRQTGGDRIGVHSRQRHTTSVNKPNGKT
ncbi:hypothetical protein MDOR_24600 [Mycolicibacterium doricum]|uniref:Uncharacterized protein n=1 Tax=Mycolicibacterium doricum TaxID=126673 RepID=A0A1X1T6Y5_9MYCO|nr:hypothetical protein [Mycolicibacterium doricum]MCV7267182.1 hypothetical protein [Mycolicibacterium doricum]ORV40300.1 hypothetical protein AWC01_12235 [Mycolicibacterium doricum]BBZ08291.1 hypothetical protein MDOR_24600 [Mycolicibacterium doricum]